MLIDGIKNNSYHAQELLSAAAIGTLTHVLGKRFISPISVGTAVAGVFNGCGLLITAKSVNTLITNSKAEEDKKNPEASKKAKQALISAVIVLTASSTLRATNILQTKFKTLPQFNAHVKPLAGLSLLNGGGSFALLLGFKELNAMNTKRIADNKQKAQDAYDASLAEIKGNTQEQIKDLDEGKLKTLRSDIEKVLKNKLYQKDHLSDELLGWVNDQAGELSIEGWQDLKNPAA